MDLSIITVNLKDKHILTQIKSVIDGTQNISYEQIVSDNGSTDGSLEEIKQNFPSVKIVENKANLGFGAANNNGLKLATGEFILFLNPDMQVQSGTLEKVVSWMREHKDVGIMGCKLIDQNGIFSENAKPRRFPTLKDQVAILLKLPHLFPKVLDNYMYKGFDSEKEQEVDSVRGSFMVIRKEIVDKLGWGFDPRYFIWFEDVDICREVQKMGYKVFYTPQIICTDYVGQTFKAQPNLTKQKWFTESMVKYFKKWHPAWQGAIIACLRPIAIGLVWIDTKLKNKN